MRAIILAGGKGTRLLPYTTILPKPLMPVGEQAVVEVLIRQLSYYGCSRVTIALGHLAHLVQAVLGTGSKFNVEIDYSVEDLPLGTCGPLALISGLSHTFLVLNGDVLTNMDFRGLIQFHKDNAASATIATHVRCVHTNYGVVKKNGCLVTSYDEKPVIRYEVSMGVYVLEPSVLDLVPAGSYLDFPDLVQTLLNQGQRVLAYPYDGIWFDLGRPEDFQAVQLQLGTLMDKIPFLNGAQTPV